MATIHWTAQDRGDLTQVAAEVLRWRDYVPDSPLYRLLATHIAADDAILEVVAAIPGVPPLNLLFGGVKLMLTPADALAAWYPHLAEHGVAEPSAAAYEAFREFVVAHRAELVHVGTTRRTQTNEVARAAVLLPWLPTGDEPLHAIDLGASAGLNLCLDAFAYRYTSAGGEARIGRGDLTLECDNRGGFDLPQRTPPFASRTGIDLSPVDATDPAQAAWLEALVWPEHMDRLERLRAAIALRAAVDVRMVAGDAAQRLVDVADGLPPGPVVIWHTIALYQADARARRDIDAAVEQVARRRTVTRVGFEPVEDGDNPVVRVGTSFDDGETVAVAHAHGRWIDRPDAAPHATHPAHSA